MENIQKRPIILRGLAMCFPKTNKVKYLVMNNKLYNLPNITGTKGAVFSTKHLCDALKRI